MAKSIFYTLCVFESNVSVLLLIYIETNRVSSVPLSNTLTSCFSSNVFFVLVFVCFHLILAGRLWGMCRTKMYGFRFENFNQTSGVWQCSNFGSICETFPVYPQPTIWNKVVTAKQWTTIHVYKYGSNSELPRQCVVVCICFFSSTSSFHCLSTFLNRRVFHHRHLCVRLFFSLSLFLCSVCVCLCVSQLVSS